MKQHATKAVIFCCFLLPVLAICAAGQEETLLLRQPTVSADHVAFVYAGDIWIANRDGSSARRLTVNPSVESNPMFSPDGRLIAFSGNYDGNTDVYTIPIAGGQPKRITFHPGDDQVAGWTPDDKRILFSSTRYSTTGRYSRLYSVPVDGGFPEPLPMPMAERGSYSPDGTHIAYTPIRDAFQTWKRYRGGRVPPVWLFDLKTYDVVEVPHGRASDTCPVWLGDEVYFLSDRNHTMNLFAYDTRTKEVTQVTRHRDFDVKSASAGGGVIIYEQGGRLHVLNPETGQSTALKIRVAPDLPYTRPHYEKAAAYVRNADISPAGVRAVFEVRGDIFTVPAKKGDVRNLTQTPGVMERDPAWSPDGRWIAYFSDAGGEYKLMLHEQTGFAEPKAISLGKPTFYYSPKWSPDGRKIIYIDKRLNLFYFDMKTSKPVHVDTDTYDHIQPSFDPVWSPDSQWIAYAKRLDNQLRAIYLYEVATKKATQVTDARSDADSPSFSRDGRYLFFSASTSLGLNVGWQDMSSYERPIRRNIYVAVLGKEQASPFAPESDEESVKTEEKKTEEKKDAKGKAAEEKKVEVRIALEGLDQRIVALPLPARNYGNLQTAADGKLFYLALGERMHQEASYGPEGNALYRFDMKERKEKSYMERVRSYWISQDGKSLLYHATGNVLGIVKTAEEPKPGDGKLDLERMDIYADPRAEWTQMFNEAWRIQRDFFYAANMNGANWPAIREKYRSFLAHVGHRSDLNFIFGEMFGELVAGHAYVSGGDMPEADRVAVGLLGADYEVVDGSYRFARIYSGENWNPDLRAPLTEPGVNVAKGDYLLAVNGRSLKAPTEVYSLFERTSGRMTVLTVNSKPRLEGARTVTVVPIADESGLRHRAWIEDNRRKVDEMSGGRIAYVYMPNTAEAGYTYFNRYYFSQLDREAVVIDERFNGGGSLADYIIDMLSRPLLCNWATREGKPFHTPGASIFGPKAMIINEYAGSGGDAMPLFFRRRGLGKLIGKRTWGGLIGIYNYPALMDGGRVTAPRMAIYSPDGKWEVENEGVAPDIEVEMTPKLVLAGHDPQLEKAVEVLMQELKKNPVKLLPRPSDPIRVK
jgi:tricorn protease